MQIKKRVYSTEIPTAVNIKKYGLLKCDVLQFGGHYGENCQLLPVP